MITGKSMAYIEEKRCKVKDISSISKVSSVKFFFIYKPAETVQGLLIDRFYGIGRSIKRVD